MSQPHGTGLNPTDTDEASTRTATTLNRFRYVRDTDTDPASTADWTIDTAQKTNHACQNCGSSVSPAYHRKNRDTDEKLYGCPSCYGTEQLLRGAHRKGNHGEKRIQTTEGLRRR